MNEFNMNEFLAKTTVGLAAEIFSVFADRISGGIKQFQIKFKAAFKEYLITATKHYGTTKTLLYRDVPVPLYDYYVHLNVRHNKKIVDTSNVKNLLKVGRRLLVTGTAGCGKSTLTKHLFLDTLKHTKFIPLYFELRNIKKTTRLIDALYERITNLGFTLEKEYFLKALETGSFALYLDGYDEILPEVRDFVSQEILHITEKYQNCFCVVTSRPEESFVSWHSFSELRTMPLDKSKAMELIGKIKYDKIIKNKFLADLKNNLFKQHESFLSNPLLLTIMLMTYSEFAAIPSKIHVFYSQVFDTLFSRHDARKGAYKRHMNSNLSINDFKKVMACFSILSYFDRKIAFKKDELINYLNKSKRMVQIEFDTEDFILDLLNSVCLLREDGIEFVFTHRSFQEYFSAIFVSSAKRKNALFIKIKDRIYTDNVISILFELDQDFIESKFVIPNLEKIYKKTSFKLSKSDISFVKFVISQKMEITLFKESVVCGSDGKGLNFFNFLSGVYGPIKYSSAYHKKRQKEILSTFPKINDKEGIKMLLKEKKNLLKYAKIDCYFKTQYVHWMKALKIIKVQYNNRKNSIDKFLLS